MRVQLLVALTLTLFLASAPVARADWEKTRWGMTQAEAKAAYPTAVLIAPGLLRVNGPFTVAGMTFPAIGLQFYDGDHLKAILLVPVPSDVPKLQADLSLAFGEGSLGVFNISNERRVVVTFSDTVRGYNITLTYSVGSDPSNRSLMLFPLSNTGAPADPAARLPWQCQHGLISAACDRHP